MKRGKNSRFRSASKEIRVKITQIKYLCRRIFNCFKKRLFEIYVNLVTLYVVYLVLFSLMFTKPEKSADGLPYPYICENCLKMGKFSKNLQKTRARLVQIDSESEGEEEAPGMPTLPPPPADPVADQDEAILREQLRHGAAYLPERVGYRTQIRQVFPTISETRNQLLTEAIQANPQWFDPVQVSNISSSNADVETVTISDSSDIFDQDTVTIEDSNAKVTI